MTRTDMTSVFNAGLIDPVTFEVTAEGLKRIAINDQAAAREYWIEAWLWSHSNRDMQTAFQLISAHWSAEARKNLFALLDMEKS